MLKGDLKQKLKDLENSKKQNTKSNLKELREKLIEDKIQKSIYALSNLIIHNEMLRTYQITFLKQIDEIQAQYDKSIKLIAENNIKISKLSHDIETTLQKYPNQ
jgi:hypothetical protein